MKYWLITLGISLLWVALALGAMYIHTQGEDSFLMQKYAQIAACGFSAIWAMAILIRLSKRSSTPK